MGDGRFTQQKVAVRTLFLTLKLVQYKYKAKGGRRVNYIENELVGKRLRNVRIRAGKGCYEMALALGISEGHYRKIERGLYGLDVRKMILLKKKMGVDPMYLLGEERGSMIIYSPSGEPADRNAYVCELLEYCKVQLEEMAEENDGKE